MIDFPIYLIDFDGTIAATRPAAVACLGRALGEHGVAVPEELMIAVTASGVSLEATFAALAPGLARAEVVECAARYRALYPDIDRDMTRLFDGVHETIAALHRAGAKIVVVSNKGRVALEAALARFDLLDKVSAVLAADPDVPLKPDAQAFHARVRPLFPDFALADFLMVGDTATDIAFAQAAGIASCWVSYGYGETGECLAMKPDFVADGPADLLAKAPTI